MSEQATLPLLFGPEAAVAGVLARHRGKSCAVGRSALCEATGLPDRQVREAIKRLVSEHHLPIASSGAGGYFWITNPDELWIEAGKLTDYIVSLANRLRALVGSEEAQKLLGQEGLFDAGAAE